MLQRSIKHKHQYYWSMRLLIRFTQTHISRCLKVADMCLWPEDCWCKTLKWPCTLHWSYLVTYNRRLGLFWECPWPVKWLCFLSCHGETHSLLPLVRLITVCTVKLSLLCFFYCPFKVVLHQQPMWLYFSVTVPPAITKSCRQSKQNCCLTGQTLCLFKSPSYEHWPMIITHFKVHHWAFATQSYCNPI